jgi:hypothetical protein
MRARKKPLFGDAMRQVIIPVPRPHHEETGKLPQPEANEPTMEAATWGRNPTIPSCENGDFTPSRQKHSLDEKAAMPTGNQQNVTLLEPGGEVLRPKSPEAVEARPKKTLLEHAKAIALKKRSIPMERPLKSYSLRSRIR